MEEYIGQIKDILLGQDFLTWLWYRSENHGGRFATDKGDLFEIHLIDKVSVQGGEGDTLETATVSGPMSELKEAKLGLATGKKVTKGLVRIEAEPDGWQCMLKAEDFALGAFKTPVIEPGGDDDEPDAAFLEKMFLIERGMRFIDAAYKEFLTHRLGSKWPGELSGIRNWLGITG